MTSEQKAAHARMSSKLHRYIYRKLTAEAPDKPVGVIKERNPLYTQIEQLLDEKKGTSIQRIANQLIVEKHLVVRAMTELVREKRILNLSEKGKVGMFILLNPKQKNVWGH
tara:strand:- start:669 stop:1001 length:333 start_codon:yes stop_codon:yes gene_type:complete